MADLDDILDQALDDFDEQEIKTKVNNVSNNLDETDEAKNDEFSTEQQQRDELEYMRKLLSEMENPTYGETLQNTLKSLSTTQEGNENVEQLFDQLAKQFQKNEIPNIVPTNPNDPNIQFADREVAGTLNMLGSAQEGMEGMEASKLEEAGETMMQDMVSILT